MIKLRKTILGTIFHADIYVTALTKTIHAQN